MTRARELADAFDRSFAEPARSTTVNGADALAIRVGTASYVVALAEIGLVARAPKIVPLPNGSPVQLGIAGIRGSLFTVFSLGALLRVRGASHGWIATCADLHGVAIAFDELDGQTTLTPGEPHSNLLHLVSVLAQAGVTEAAR